MIESGIQAVLKALREERKDHLANVIEKNWNKTVRDYSASLYKYKPANIVEPELLNAIQTVLKKYDYSPVEINSISQSFIKHRVIQTTHHLDICTIPRWLTINWLATRGIPKDAWYLVFAFSGIPFGNASRPGCLKFSQHELTDVVKENTDLYKTLKKDLINSKSDRKHDLERISIMPSSMQDEIVYRSSVKNRTIEVMNNLTDTLKQYFPIPKLNDSYTKYALNTTRKIESNVLNLSQIAYLDINEITTEYLLEILKNKNHIVTKILFDPKTRGILAPVIPTEAIFYSTFTKNSKNRQESVFLTPDGFTKSENHKLHANPESIINALKNDRLAPGLFLTYLVFKFVNGARCLGSFVAAEYLPTYKEKLIGTGLMKDYNLESIPTDNLTTGMLPDKSLEQVTAIDILLGTKWKPNENMLYGELLLSLMDVLYGRDFNKK